MRNPTLLDRQLDLLRYLTNTDMVFGGAGLSRATADPSLRGFSLPLLRLEAEMSFSKRMGKISKVLDRTFAYLGHRRVSIFREFANASPPTTFQRYHEALAFYEFLLRRWDSMPPSPPFLPDIAKLEIVSAKLRALRINESTPLEPATQGQFVRLSEGAEVLHFRYDIRPLFETKDLVAAVPQSERYVLVALVRRMRSPRIISLSPEMATLLAGLTTWTPLNDTASRLANSNGDVTNYLKRLIRAGALESSQPMLQSGSQPASG